MSPKRNFYPLPPSTGTTINSVDPPLFISGGVLGISDATVASRGTVSTIHQHFGGVKDFFDGFTAGSSQTIGSISTDSTFAVATDSELATKKAIKDYFASASLLASVTYPLTLVAKVLDIADASAVSDGIVTTGAQTLAGDKTFPGMIAMTNPFIGASSTTGALTVVGTAGFAKDIWVGDTIYLDGVPLFSPTRIYATRDGSILTLLAGPSGPQFAISSPLVGGTIVAQPVAGQQFIVRDVLSTLPIFDTCTAGTRSFAPTIINTNVTPQLLLQSLLGQVEFSIVSNGDLLINCSGNNLNLHATDQISVLNTGDSLAPSSGALVVSGGLGVAKSIYCSALTSYGAQPYLGLMHSSNAEGAQKISATGAVSYRVKGTNPLFTFDFESVPNPPVTGVTLSLTTAQFTGDLSALSLLSTGGSLRLGVPVSPSIAPTSDNSLLQIQAANTISSGARLILRSNAGGGHADLVGGTGGSLRFSTSTTANLISLAGATSTFTGISELTCMTKTATIEDKLLPSGAGPFNDYAVSSASTLYKVDLASVVSGAHFTGFSMTDALRPGRIMVLYFYSAVSKTVYIDHNSAGSLAKNRVACPGAVDMMFVVNPSSSVTLHFMTDANQWGVLSGTASASVLSPVSTSVVHVLAGAATGSVCIVYYQRVGQTVTAFLSAVNHTSAGVGTITFNPGSPIPAEFRPSYDSYGNMMTYNGAAVPNQYYGGWFAPAVSGVMQFFPGVGTPNFAGAGSIGWPATSLTWTRL